jgi:hypothetical protein
MIKEIDNLFQKLEGKKKAAPKRKTKKTATKSKPTLNGAKKAAPKRKTGKSNAGALKLKAITTKAKAIRKAHSSKTWQQCIKEASRLV